MSVSTHRVFTMRAALLMTLAATVPGAAQQPPPQSPPTAPAPKMALTGCLRAGPNPTGVPDTITYTLEIIETSPPASATGGELTRGKTPSRYTLTTGTSIELKPHVGHTVEITGHLKDLSSGDAAARVKRDPQAKTPQPGGAHNTFEVATLTMLAATCP
jgi:hypothetical protein